MLPIFPRWKANGFIVMRCTQYAPRSLACVFFYLWPDPQTTSLSDVVYVCYHRRTTALTFVVLGDESLLQLHRLFSAVTIFNTIDVWGTWIHNFFFISHCHDIMESFQKSVYKLLYFVDFWGCVVTFIFGYISSTTWSNTKLRFVRLKVLCIVIFVYVHNYLILSFFSCACHEKLLYWHSNFWGCEVNF